MMLILESVVIFNSFYDPYHEIMDL